MESRSPVPRASAILPICLSGDTQARGLNPALEMREEGPLLMLWPEARPLTSCCPWLGALHSTEHWLSPPPPSALKSRAGQTVLWKPGEGC